MKTDTTPPHTFSPESIAYADAVDALTEKLAREQDAKAVAKGYVSHGHARLANDIQKFLALLGPVPVEKLEGALRSALRLPQAQGAT